MPHFVFKPAEDGPRLFSMWVAALPRCVSSELSTPLLGSPVGEWPPCLTVFFLNQFMLPRCISRMLTTPVLGSPGSEWLPRRAAPALLCFRPADDACPRLSRECVAAVRHCVLSVLMVR